MASGNPFSVVSIVQSDIEETLAVNLRNVTHATFTNAPDGRLSGKVYFVGSDVPHELHPDEVEAVIQRMAESD